jgi:phage-related protein
MPTLQLDVTADATAAAASLDALGGSARNVAADVDAAAASSDVAAGRMDGLAGSAENLDSKSSAAAGAFGALAGGLEAAGFEGAAAGMQGLAIATDTASGVGGLMTLVMESQAVATLSARAASVGHAVATAAQTTATTVATGAQWALNAALTANPIGLVIALVVALAAAVVIAYNKSETFRDVVDTAMDKARTAVGWVVDKVEDLVGWVSDAVGGWDGILDAAETAMGGVETAVDLATTPIRTMIQLVQDLIGWISRIDFPDIDIPGVGRVFAEDTILGRPGLGSAGGGGVVFRTELTLAAAQQDQDTAMRTMVEGLREYFARQGMSLDITGGTL